MFGRAAIFKLCSIIKKSQAGKHGKNDCHIWFAAAGGKKNATSANLPSNDVDMGPACYSYLTLFFKNVLCRQDVTIKKPH